MRIETLAVHSGHAVDPTTGAVAPPIQLSTTFERNPDGTYRGAYSYSRSDNPNRRALELALAAVEGGADAAAFGSGSLRRRRCFRRSGLAITSSRRRRRITGPASCCATSVFRGGLQVAFVDMTDLSAVAAAVTPQTRMLWAETPSNPQLKITDLAEVARIAHGAGAVCVVDNTWAPIVQRPFEQGADLVVHSTTKYIGGHSDVTGGAVIARASDEVFQRIRMLQGTGGAIPSPFDCWLVLRGVQTLPWRMRAHSKTR
jgi:cystathionine gamma-synthase